MHNINVLAKLNLQSAYGNLVSFLIILTVWFPWDYIIFSLCPARLKVFTVGNKIVNPLGDDTAIHDRISFASGKRRGSFYDQPELQQFVLSETAFRATTRVYDVTACADRFLADGNCLHFSFTCILSTHCTEFGCQLY